MNTASIYLRLSRASREESTGLGSQEADLRELAARHGLQVAAVRTDDGESGALRNRPGFLAWLEDARSGRVDHLLAYRLDRVSRGGSAGLARFLDVLEGVDADGNRVGRPVRFLSVADGLDSTSAAWDIQAAVMGALAKSERELIRSRIVRSKTVAKAEGRWMGGVVPAGFRVVPNPGGPGKVVEPDPAKVEVLREAARSLITDSLGAATHVLERSDVRPPRAAHWTRNTTAQLLLCEAAMVKLWTPSEARAIRSALRDRRPRISTRKRPKRVVLLTGVLFCAGCRRPMVFTGKGERGHARYQCQSWATSAPCPARASVRADLVEALVEEAYLDGWGGFDEVRVASHHDERADRLAVLSDDIEQLWAAVPTMPASERPAAIARIEELEAEHRAAEAEPVQLATTFRTTGRSLRDAWATGDVEDRNRMLRHAQARLFLRRNDAGRKVYDLDPSRVAGLDELRDPV